MLPHLTDRQILERILIPAMMQAVVLGIKNSLGDDGGLLDPVQAQLHEALEEPLGDIAPDRLAKLLRRSKRICTLALSALVDQPAGVQYLAIARLTADLAERDIIVIGADSAFATAWDLMSEVMSLSWDIMEPLGDRATTTADVMLDILMREGFYHG